jgi:uncharacterized membrane protein
MTFDFEPVWSWPLALVVSAALLAVVLITYPPRVRHLSPRTRRLLIGLRVLSALTLIFALWRPSVRFTEKDERGARMIVLMDKSRSMNTPDGPGGITRREALVRALKENADRLKKISETIDLRFMDFADEATPASSEPDAVGDGKFTAIGKVLDELRKEDSGSRLVGVLLMSDGAQRAIGPDDVDPQAAARRFAEQKGAPIYPVAFGSSDLSSVGMDLAVESLTVDPLPFERKTVPVSAQIRVTGAAGRKVKVRLLLENRAGKNVGQSGEMVPIAASAQARPIREFTVPQGVTAVNVNLTFVAELAGEYKLALEVIPVDEEPRELKVANNRLETLINVGKGGLKVAYFDIPRHEASFLRRLGENAKVQLDWQLVLPGKKQAATRIDPRLFDRGAYDVYIIGDVPAAVFRQPNVDLLDRLADRVTEGAGLMMTGGKHNFGAGGYSQTRLASKIPVLMSTADILAPGEQAPDQQINRKLQMLPTQDGLTHFVMQIAVNDNEETWKRLPPLDGANRLKPINGSVDILARAAEPESADLLFATDTGGGRVMAFAADSTWRWRMHGFAAVHQRFWEQMLLWLARKEAETDQPVWAVVEPRNFAPGGRAPIRFGARDAEKKPIADAAFKVEVLTPKGERRAVTPQKAGDENLAEFTATDEPGDYWATVSATHDGKAVGLPATTRFLVDARDPELDNPAANPDLMANLAKITGATSVTPENLGEFLDRLLNEGVAAELTRNTTISLWDGWPLLLTFVLLMTTEWFIRKRRGLV